jgi:hypothetical protein
MRQERPAWLATTDDAGFARGALFAELFAHTRVPSVTAKLRLMARFPALSVLADRLPEAGKSSATHWWAE